MSLKAKKLTLIMVARAKIPPRSVPAQCHGHNQSVRVFSNVRPNLERLRDDLATYSVEKSPRVSIRVGSVKSSTSPLLDSLFASPS